MEHEITNWFESLNPKTTTIDGLNLQSDAIYQGLNRMLEVHEELSNSPETDDFVFSFPTLTGDNKVKLLKEDEGVVKAYSSGGASDPTFLNKFKGAPVTGIATLLNFVQNQKGFIPQEGHFSIQEFGGFMHAFGTCPIVNTGSVQSLEHNSTISNIKESNFDRKDIVDTIIQIYNLDPEEQDEISEKLKNVSGDIVKFTIYNLQISGSSNEAFLEVSAGVATITRTENHKFRKRFQFEINIKGNHIVSSIQTANWASFAPKLAEKHFTSIPEWIKSNQLPS
ncbi:MAG: hypothetical protein ACI8ZO_001663 [Flavobacteriales bacterium]|jgi:hypothetical protein